jgi:hypothetical protein
MVFKSVPALKRSAKITAEAIKTYTVYSAVLMK